MNPRLHFLLERPIAHRGLHDAQRPENSLAAFEAACRAGYSIELDVHPLRDGEVAVFHDATLDRLTGHSGEITACTRDDLRSLRLAGTAEPIPLLSEVLELVAGRVPLIVELKSHGRGGVLEAAVWRLLRNYHGLFTIQSFDPFTVAWFRRHAPHVVRGLLASDFADGSMPWYRRFVMRRLLLSPLAAPDYVGYDLRALPYWAPSLLRYLGRPLLAWTVRTEADWQRSVRLADNCIFENIRPALS